MMNSNIDQDAIAERNHIFEKDQSGLDRIFKAVSDIRLRQYLKGRTPEEDNANYPLQELALAAAVYAAPCPIYRRETEPVGRDFGLNTYVEAWPWMDEHNKSRQYTRKQCLLHAIAMLVAQVQAMEVDEPGDRLGEPPAPRRPWASHETEADDYALYCAWLREHLGIRRGITQGTLDVQPFLNLYNFLFKTFEGYSPD